MVSSLVAGDAEAATTSPEMVQPGRRCWTEAQRSSWANVLVTAKALPVVLILGVVRKLEVVQFPSQGRRSPSSAAQNWGAVVVVVVEARSIVEGEAGESVVVLDACRCVEADTVVPLTAVTFHNGQDGQVPDRSH